MTMHVVRRADGRPFSPVGHVGVEPVRLHGGESSPTSDFTVVLSRYRPGGAAELASLESETVYVVMSGELVMSSDGAEVTLGPLDSVHFAAGDTRTVENRADASASMLVIRSVRHT
jgi:uncharacterized cupin superfamily protein